MKDFQRTSLKRRIGFVVILSGLICDVHAADYSNLYFFGDSLTDSGVFRTILPATVSAYSRFTTNPGTTWAKNLGANYNKSVTPAYAARTPSPYAFDKTASGNNFAVGSARINAAPVDASGVAIPPVSVQVSDIIARGPLDSKALYAISGGHNDIFTQLSGGSSTAGIAACAIAANDLTAQVNRLQLAGARNLIVVGIMDISKAPIAKTVDSALLGNLVTTFNQTLVAGLAGKSLLYFDTGKLLNTVIASPTAYGFTNISEPACPTSSLGCKAPEGTDGYLFADVRHPSAKFHKIISDWVYASLEGASRMGLLSQVPLGRSGAQWRAIDGRLREFQNFGYQGQGVFVTGDYASSSIDAYAGQPSANGSSRNFVLGYEKAFTPRLFGGVSLGYGNAPFDLGNNLGTVKYNEWALSAFVSHKTGNFYANALTSYSWLDYESKRNVTLGSLRTTERGDTRGGQFGVKGQVGYNFVNGDILHGPLAGFAYERVNVDGFSEKSNSVAAMSFGDQTRKSLRSRLGWQVASETSWFGAKAQPYAQLTYDYEHKKDERTYRAGFVGGNSAMQIQTANRTGGYGTVLAGVNAALSKDLRLGIGISTTINQPGARNSAVNITLSAPL